MSRIGLAWFVTLVSVTAASAQSEDVEPRIVGSAGVTTIGLSGFLDKFASTEESFPLIATAQVDLTRFITGRLAVRGGLIGTASFGGDDSDERPTGPGAPALHALGGLFFYFTPRSMVSFYSGGEYRAPLTPRPERDAGTMLGKGGLEAALSSRVGMFVEGGYGVRLTRGEDDERQTRIVGEIGFRIRF
jgi:hypothetical protein